MSSTVEKRPINVGDIPFSKNIDVATNELFLRSTINRNTERLLSNDLYLYDFVVRFKENGDYTILPWKASTEYCLGDVVVYTEYNRDKDAILNLYLLQCTVDGNVAEPQKRIIDGYVADFSDSGWNNLNPFLALFYSEDPESNLSNYLAGVVSNRFELSHELDPKYHKFGNLEEHALSDVALNSSATNIADERDCGYWPYETIEVKTDAYSGTMRKWGMGLVEYDLTCKLVGSQKVTRINSEGDIETVNYLAANAYSPISSELNDNYFMNRSAYSIFMKNGDPHIVDINGVMQTNLLSTVNMYHGKIEFPIPFADTNYMMFVSPTTDGSEIGSPCALTFADKTEKSIEMVYAIPNYNELPMEEIALKHNEFQCQVVGKWR